MWWFVIPGKGISCLLTFPVHRENAFVGPNPLKGSYRRNGDGDYLCDSETVHAMLRDSDLRPLDRKIVGG